MSWLPGDPIVFPLPIASPAPCLLISRTCSSSFSSIQQVFVRPPSFGWLSYTSCFLGYPTCQLYPIRTIGFDPLGDSHVFARRRSLVFWDLPCQFIVSTVFYTFILCNGYCLIKDTNWKFVKRTEFGSTSEPWYWGCVNLVLKKQPRASTGGGVGGERSYSWWMSAWPTDFCLNPSRLQPRTEPALLTSLFSSTMARNTAGATTVSWEEPCSC